MNNVEKEIKTIKQNLKGVRNEQICSRAWVLIRVLGSKNKTQTLGLLGWKRNKYYFWLNRLREADYNIYSLADQSRAPKSNSRAISEKIIKLAFKVRDENNGVGAQNTAYFMKEQHGVYIHASTLGYILQRRNISKKYRVAKKNPHNKRYSLDKPLERVQTDTVSLGIVDNHGNQIKAYPVIDDHSRLAFVHVADEHSNYEATKGMEKFIRTIGKPKSVQTDNGAEFTNHFLSCLNPIRKKEAVLSGFEQMLQDNEIHHKLIKPRTPQLNGKVERFNQTLKKGLEGKIKDGMSIDEIQKIVNEFLAWYNKIKPHSSLNFLTPYQAFVKGKLGEAA